MSVSECCCVRLQPKAEADEATLTAATSDQHSSAEQSDSVVQVSRMLLLLLLCCLHLYVACIPSLSAASAAAPLRRLSSAIDRANRKWVEKRSELCWLKLCDELKCKQGRERNMMADADADAATGCCSRKRRGQKERREELDARR